MADWFLTFAANSVYGIALILVPVFGLFFLAKKLYPKTPHPLAATLIIGIVAMLILPSYPRYKFERETLAKIQTNKHLKLVNTVKYGDLTEPLTWLYTPIGFFHIISPSGETGEFYTKDATVHHLDSALLRYNEEPVIEKVEADCSDK